MPMREVSSTKNLKALRNRRAVLLLEQVSRDAALYYELTYSLLSLFLSETIFFPSMYSFSFLIFQ